MASEQELRRKIVHILGYCTAVPHNIGERCEVVGEEGVENNREVDQIMALFASTPQPPARAGAGEQEGDTK